ncbi:MAG: hypothetical protein WCY08_11790 [Rhodocyclaceae bacterium]
MTDHTSYDGAERRQYLHVREIFDDALDIIEPFFAPENSWGTHAGLDHLAYRTLREHYPELSSEEVHVLVMAARRLFSTRTWD